MRCSVCFVLAQDDGEGEEEWLAEEESKSEEQAEAGEGQEGEETPSRRTTRAMKQSKVEESEEEVWLDEQHKQYFYTRQPLHK